MREPPFVQGIRTRTAPGAALASLLLLAACQSHSAAWDDAWAQCDAEAIEQMEFADPDADQRATWRERYIGACMQARGFSDPQYLIR